MDNIIEEVLQELKTYLKRFIPGVNEMILNYKGNNEEKAMKTLPYAIEGLQWIMEVVDKTNIFLMEKDGSKEINELNKSYKEMIIALENNDYIQFFNIMEKDVLSFIYKIDDRLNYYN
jgi:hypothetical protein